MAIIQRRLLACDDESAIAYLEYDDVTMYITGIRVYNNSSNSVYIMILRKAGNIVYDYIFPIGETYLPIPTSPQGRITLIDEGRGRFGNLFWGGRYPA